MATQIFHSKHPVLPPRQATDEFEIEQPETEQPGGLYRGFLFALLFDVVLVLLFIGAWEFWCLVR